MAWSRLPDLWVVACALLLSLLHCLEVCRSRLSPAADVAWLSWKAHCAYFITMTKESFTRADIKLLDEQISKHQVISSPSHLIPSHCI